MWTRRIIAAVLVVVGAAWFVQGIGVLGGSPMTGNAFWAVVRLPMAAAPADADDHDLV